jgi:hypothetical protein
MEGKDVNLVVFTGYPHCGKSSLSGWLKGNGYTVQSTDEITEELYPGEFVVNLPVGDIHYVIDTLIGRKNESVRKSEDTVTDTCAVDNWYRERQLTVPRHVLRELYTNGHELQRYLVHLDVDRDELMKRNLEDPRRDREGVLEIFRRLDACWHEPESYRDDIGNLTIVKYPNNTLEDQANAMADLSKRLKLGKA